MAGRLIEMRDIETGSEDIPNGVVQFREEILMPAEFVVDEFKLTDIDWSVFGSILGEENDWLISSVCDPKLEKHVRIVASDIGQQKRGAGDLVGDFPDRKSTRL